MDTTAPIRVSDDCVSARYAIDGLRFEPNVVLASDDGAGTRQTKVISNTGDIVGHFVTHAEDFRYRDYGIHVGQVDQLTFIASPAKTIKGIFIDCRKQSPTCGLALTLEFSTSSARKLVIPNGVAHTFEDIADVVTRNDMKLFSDPYNPSWSVENDNHTFLLDTPADQIPRLEVNRYPLPFSAAVMFFRMQQEIMRGGRTVDEKPVQANIGGSLHQLVTSHENPSRPLEMPSSEGCEIPGFAFAVNSFFASAPNSWCVLPSTPSCVMDMVLYEFQTDRREVHGMHTRHEVLHTFMDRTGDQVFLDLLDLRSDSATFRDTAELTITCDPRFHVRIPAGVAYRYRGYGNFTIRVEYALFMDENEPRRDLPPIGSDWLTIQGGDLILRDGVVTPKIPAPPEGLWFLLRKELETLGIGEY